MRQCHAETCSDSPVHCCGSQRFHSSHYCCFESCYPSDAQCCALQALRSLGSNKVVTLKPPSMPPLIIM